MLEWPEGFTKLDNDKNCETNYGLGSQNQGLCHAYPAYPECRNRPEPQGPSLHSEGSHPPRLPNSSSLYRCAAGRRNYFSARLHPNGGKVLSRNHGNWGRLVRLQI